MIGWQQTLLAKLCHQTIFRKAWSIVADREHPHYSDFELMFSGQVYRIPLAKGV